jgi:hypothetical protein
MLAGTPCKLVLNSLVGYGYGHALKRKSKGAALVYKLAGVVVLARLGALDSLLAQAANNKDRVEITARVLKVFMFLDLAVVRSARRLIRS